MSNIVLKTFFKKFRDSLSSNADFRDTLNKESRHYLEVNLNNLKQQIDLVGAKREKEFNKKYEQALSVLKEKGMSNLLFTQISKTLRVKFLEHFTDLKELGVDTGHVYSNLTLASKAKAGDLFKNVEVDTTRYSSEIQSITDKDLRDISKTIALISSYTSALEELDRIQNRKDLVRFLRKSSSFSQSTKVKELRTLEDIKSNINSLFGTKKSAGITELSDQIFKNTIVNIEAQSTMQMARSIVATEDNIEVTFEIKALNQFKGNIAQGLKTSFIKVLDQLIANPEGIPAAYNKALEKAIGAGLTKQEFLELFPKVSASKTLEEAFIDIIASTTKTGKAKAYKAKSRPQSGKRSEKTKLKIPDLKLKRVKVKEPAGGAQLVKPIDLISLQNLLNSALQDTIKRNMGDGSRTDVLNYRSGRFAESVKVERLSESRQGMITAFYSYMKNPYATFSAGGRQDKPRSRDPKLLIAKSIREIAQEHVANRLRAVVL